MKRFLLSLILALSPLAAKAQLGPATGYCTNGGVRVMTSGSASSTAVQASYPRCTVNVYLAGTITPATLYSDGSSTPLANPFTANADGSWNFWAAAGAYYDITMSGGTPNAFPAPKTLSNFLINGPSSGGGGTVNPASVPFPKGYYAAVGAVISPNPINTVNALGDEVTKSINGKQSCTVGANGTLDQCYSNATSNNTSIGAIEIPVGADPSLNLNLHRVSQAYATLIVGNGVSGTLGTVIAANVGALGDGYNCSSLPTPVINAGTAGTPVSLTPNCSGGQITSWTISNSGTGYATNNFLLTATLPFPTFNPTFSNTDLRMGSRAKIPAIRVDDFGCKNDEIPGQTTGTDNYNCITAAIAETSRIIAANPGTYVKLSFTGGGAYGVYTYPEKFRTPTDDGSIPNGLTCQGIPCVNLPPLATTTNINCAFTLPQNLIVDGNNGFISGRTGEFLGLGGKTSIFCNDVGNVSINDLHIGGSNFSFIANHMFNVKMKNVNMSFNDIPMIVGVTDRISTFDEMIFTSYAPPVFGGWYWCRGPSTNNGGMCSESGGYMDGLSIGSYIYNQLGAYDETSNMVPHYPNACTGSVPAGTQNYEHSIDEWFDTYFFKSCVSGTPATNNSLTGLSFQAFAPQPPSANLAQANAVTLQLDALTPNSEVMAYGGGFVVIYSKKADGTQRTLREIADQINQPGLTGSFAGQAGSIRVNITGDPAATYSANTSPVNFSGGIASSRLPDGQIQGEYRGVTGMGLALYQMWGRPSGAVNIQTIVDEGGWRYPLFIQDVVNGGHVFVAASGEGIWGCNANSPNPMGSSSCLDPYNFFTPNTHTPSTAADNSAACYLPQFNGELAGCSTSAFGKLGVISRVPTITNTNTQSGTVQQNGIICGLYPQNATALYVRSCAFSVAFIDHIPGGNGNYTKINIGTTGESPDGGAESENITIWPDTSTGISNPNPGIQAGSFINYVIMPKQYTHSNPSDFNLGYPSDPVNPFGYYQPQSKLIFNNTKKKYRVQTNPTTSASPTSLWETVQSTPDSTADGCATFTGNIIGSTGVACGTGGGGAPSSHSFSADLGDQFDLALIGPVFQEVAAAGSSTFKSLVVKVTSIDPITCGTPPTLNLYDLSTSASTAYGSATIVQGVAISTTTGTVTTNITSTALTPGHYYSFGYSAGACVAQPHHVFVTANIQNN